MRIETKMSGDAPQLCEVHWTSRSIRINGHCAGSAAGQAANVSCERSCRHLGLAAPTCSCPGRDLAERGLAIGWYLLPNRGYDCVRTLPLQGYVCCSAELWGPEQAHEVLTLESHSDRNPWLNRSSRTLERERTSGACHRIGSRART